MSAGLAWRSLARPPSSRPGHSERSRRARTREEGAPRRDIGVTEDTMGHPGGRGAGAGGEGGERRRTGEEDGGWRGWRTCEVEVQELGAPGDQVHHSTVGHVLAPGEWRLVEQGGEWQE